MIQLFFFMSMTAVAALLLNLFWYLEDNRREEIEFEQKRHRASRSTRSASTLDMTGKRQSQLVRFGSGTPNTMRPLAVDSCRPVYHNQVRFYEIGDTGEVPSFQSVMENHSRSA